MSEWSVSEQQSDNAGFTGFTPWLFVIGILQVHVQLDMLEIFDVEEVGSIQLPKSTIYRKALLITKKH